MSIDEVVIDANKEKDRLFEKCQLEKYSTLLWLNSLFAGATISELGIMMINQSNKLEYINLASYFASFTMISIFTRNVLRQKREWFYREKQAPE